MSTSLTSGASAGLYYTTSNGSVILFPLLAVFNRALSAGEIGEISQNPWQIFQPRRRVTFSSLGAPAAATLEGHAQAQAAATGNLTLSAS
ncbi:MAG: hypothetical protein KA223_04620, partial [Candidatus Accumulibacter sp.]|nr:hypothetical protein [Accumulibacter sp.]